MDVTSAASFSIFLTRLFIWARNSSILMPRISSRSSPSRRPRMALRVRSETLRAPVTEQSLRRAQYSSSDSRTLIARDRGLRTVIGILVLYYRETAHRIRTALRQASPPSVPSLWTDLQQNAHFTRSTGRVRRRCLSPVLLAHRSDQVWLKLVTA